MEATMETHLDHDPVATGGSWVAAIAALVTLFAGPIAVVASLANQPPRDALAMTQATSLPEPDGVTPPVSYSVPSDGGDIGHFAFGYIEFDWDPQAPGGVPGFDSWPPGSPGR
jgi:hypothetical protein